MVTQKMNDDSFQRFVCLSTDVKPTDCGNGSILYEIDTKMGYCFDGDSSSWLELDIATIQQLM